MVLKQEQPKEDFDPKLEAAKENLNVAGFVLGQSVKIPDQDHYPKGEWVISKPTFLSVYGREVPAVIVSHTDSYSTLTVSLQDLCAANPIYQEAFYETPVQEINPNLTIHKILYFYKATGDVEEEIIMGMINHPIKVGSPINSTLRPTISNVEKISIEGNRYKITTVGGSTYYFDPSKSINDIQD